MELIGFIIVVAVVIFFSGLPCFETVFTIIVLLPAFYYLLAKLIAGSHLLIPSEMLALIWISLILLVLLAYALGHRYKEKKQQIDASDDILSLILFGVCFWICYRLCLMWPDFYPIGERLRDYAVLSSVLASPLAPGEPWMAGTPLHYYTYWYQLGSVLSTLFKLKTWDLYHLLTALSFALYLSFIFLLFKRHLCFSRYTSMISALIIAFGSNVAGIYEVFALTVNTQWWNASRVIPGTINEFPAWSFVLGDLHPHYMNLPFLPMAVTVFLTTQRYAGVKSPVYYFLNILAFAVLPVLFTWNSNPWDAPVWIGFVGVSMVVFFYQAQTRMMEKIDATQKLPLSLPLTLVTTLFLTGICCSLIIMGRNAPSAEYSVALVSSAAGRTGLVDLLRHWGIALSMMTFCVLYQSKKAHLRYLFLISTGVSIYLNSALCFLLALWILNIFRFIELDTSDAGHLGQNNVSLVMEAMGIGAIALLIIPELVYVNDAYKPPYERMNTIFKIYSINWFPIHAFGFYLMSQVYRHTLGVFPFPSRFKKEMLSLTLILMCAFFIRAVVYRKIPSFGSIGPSRGLGKVEATYPGAEKMIEYLSNMPSGTVIEGQGPAYSYTTHVATLASQPAYLGWINHLFLLTPYHEEIQRRIKLTDKMYNLKTTCRQRRQLMADEHIAYLVWGPMEEMHYGFSQNDRFDCLEPLYKNGRYTIFGPGNDNRTNE